MARKSAEMTPETVNVSCSGCREDILSKTVAVCIAHGTVGGLGVSSPGWGGGL